MTNAGFQMNSFAAGTIFTLILTAILWLWFSAAFFSAGYALVASTPGKMISDVFRTRWSGIALGIIIVIFGAYLYGVPSFNEKWRPEVRLQAEYDAVAGKSTMRVLGNEHLRGLRVRSDNLLRNFDDNILQDTLAIPFSADWMQVGGTQQLESSSDEFLQSRR